MHPICGSARSRSGRLRRLAAAPGAVLVAGLFAVLLTVACDRNAKTPHLVPTGIRPPPEVGTGSIVGLVRHDPLNAPDLDRPPFPPTVVELLQDGALLAADTLSSTGRWFEFSRLRPGHYTVRAVARVFLPATVADVLVASAPVDAGDLILTIDPLQVASTIHLLGDFNGFPEDFPDSIGMVQNTLGVWTHPNLDYPAQVLAPGTYRLRFVTDFFVDDSDYGGDPSVVWDAPVADAPTRREAGPGTNLAIRITAAGPYQFTLDERRQTFSVQPLTAPRRTSRR
jgi:hypothetical protein